MTLTNAAGNTGAAATATAILDQTAPSGYTISSDASTYNATTAAAAGFTFANAEVGDTYSYTISSSAGGTPVTATGTVISATEDVTGINVSSLPDGTLTFSVTLTDPAGNTGAAATATATLDQTAPSGYTISSDASTYNATTAAAAGFTFASAEVGDTFAYTITSSGGGTAVTGSGSVTSAAERYCDQRLHVARRHAHLQRQIDRPGRQHGNGGHGHGHARPDGPQRLYDYFQREHVQRHDGHRGRLHVCQRRSGRYVCLHDQRAPAAGRPSPAAAAWPRPLKTLRASTSRRCPTARSPLA